MNDTADHILEAEELKKVERAKWWKKIGMYLLFISILITNLAHVTDYLNYTWVFIVCAWIQFAGFLAVFGKIDSVYKTLNDSLIPIRRWYNQRPPSLKKPQAER